MTLRRAIVRYWPYVKDFGVALRPLRFGILGIGIIFVLWLDSYTGQGADVLIAYSHSAFLGLKSWQFMLALVVFSLVVWLTMYLAILLRFRHGVQDEPAVMAAYRAQYPAPIYYPDSADARAEADRRVKWILWLRKIAPPLLGAGAPFVTALGLLGAEGFHAFTEYAIWFALLSGIVFFLLFRVMMPKDLSANIKNSWNKIQLGWVKWLPVFAFAALLFIAGTSFVDPVSWGLRLGPIIVFFSVVALIVISGTAVSLLSRQSSLPIFLIVLLFLIVWHRLAPDERVRYLDSANTSSDIEHRLHPVDAIDHWLRGNHLQADQASDNSPSIQQTGPKVSPVVFVSAAGGGSRAAYWTAAILGALEDQTDRKFSNHLIAISGVSGGSLGAAIYRSLLSADERVSNYQQAGQEAAAGDFLGPVLAAMATHDILPPLSGADRSYASEEEIIFHGDRAVAIEQAWERSWSRAVCGNDSKDCPNLFAGSFIKLFNERPLPALLLNGTAVETGARVVTSSLRIECDSFGANQPQPCTSKMRDISDFLAHLADHAPEKKGALDIRVSTAVSNSARFPVVLPAATANIALSVPQTGPQPPDRPPQRVPVEARIVDGGYFENFGATTMHELILELGEKLKNTQLAPVIVQISSDPELSIDFDPGYGRPMVKNITLGHFFAQLRAPLQAYYMTRDAHGTQARLLLEDDAKQLGFRYFHFRICPQPRSNPPLAWILSDQAQERLRASLESSTESCNNKDAFKTLVNCIKERTEAACRPQKSAG